ncbi:MAG: hypothetical protein ABIG44_01385 [Planctomycetota bacterium]
MKSARMITLCLLFAVLNIVPAGCTRESVRVALETQRRADQVQQAVFERQHESLRILLYRDLVNRLEVDGEELSAEQREVLNQVWNERDLFEFWTIQQERARALRLVGVDAKLASDQSIVDLLIKGLEARAERVEEALATLAGTAVAEQASDTSTEE